MEAINIQEKFSQIKDLWHPYIIGELNENYIKLCKIKGEFVWHKHDEEDELFIIFKVPFIMDFMDKTIAMHEGDIIIVPKGVEHRPRTVDGEAWNMLIEPKATKHSGEVQSDKTVEIENQEWI